ncbi:hypothetical protein COV16_00360 [Candidatus Woesearchaeota archaeon CG10_big_fil_rev_8_21_14_0_10_34_8]|nr:MAG: hypothetical protein COV16_00360 [Candidatus Woesearchaeota archaeon CG10_big_fil_rev_8_21_14_0_10_34_8]
MRKIEKLFIRGVSKTSKIADAIGLYYLLRKINKNKVIILMYHGVTSSHDPVANFDHKHVLKEMFEKQLQYIKKHYSLISLNDFIEWKQRKKKNLPNNSVILTFDDGYANCYTQLFPILRKHSADAAVFLPTKYISKEKIAWYDTISYCIAKTKKTEIEINRKKYTLQNNKQKIAALVELKLQCRDFPEKNRYLLEEIKKQTGVDFNHCTNENLLFLSWVQCKEMQDAGITFGSHSITHQVMTQLTESEMENEISKSKKIIVKRLKTNCSSFAYPFGNSNESVRTILRKSEYLIGLTTDYGKNTVQTENMQLFRIAVNNMYDLNVFALNLHFNFMAFHHLLLVQYSKIKKLLR